MTSVIAPPPICDSDVTVGDSMRYLERSARICEALRSPLLPTVHLKLSRLHQECDDFEGAARYARLCADACPVYYQEHVHALAALLLLGEDYRGAARSVKSLLSRYVSTSDHLFPQLLLGYGCFVYASDPREGLEYLLRAQQCAKKVYGADHIATAILRTINADVR